MTDLGRFIFTVLTIGLMLVGLGAFGAPSLGKIVALLLLIGGGACLALSAFVALWATSAMGDADDDD